MRCKTANFPLSMIPLRDSPPADSVTLVTLSWLAAVGIT
jgi:hypothetical protein